MIWSGVMPAITTPFAASGAIDHDALALHLRGLEEAGCTGIVTCGSLGEGTTLDPDEKMAVVATARKTLEGRIPVVAGIAAASTAEAARQVETARKLGAEGFMILPPYLHRGPFQETTRHIETLIAAAAPLGCMLYNNPAAYGVDILPEAIATLAARHPNLLAVKDSTGDSRRVTAVRARLGDRLACFIGLDDMVLEGVAAGAIGWVAGLVNALPKESVALFEAARHGDRERAEAIYRWFLPLLRFDVVPEFVQLIKLTQARTGRGDERVRAPRLPVAGTLRQEAESTIAACLKLHPLLFGTDGPADR